MNPSTNNQPTKKVHFDWRDAYSSEDEWIEPCIHFQTRDSALDWEGMYNISTTTTPPEPFLVGIEMNPGPERIYSLAMLCVAYLFLTHVKGNTIQPYCNVGCSSAPSPPFLASFGVCTEATICGNAVSIIMTDESPNYDFDMYSDTECGALFCEATVEPDSCESPTTGCTDYFSSLIILSDTPTAAPTESPTEAPTDAPTDAPTETPTESPTESPTEPPTESPTEAPTETPTTSAPTETPTTPYCTCIQEVEIIGVNMLYQPEGPSIRVIIMADHDERFDNNHLVGVEENPGPQTKILTHNDRDINDDDSTWNGPKSNMKDQTTQSDADDLQLQAWRKEYGWKPNVPDVINTGMLAIPTIEQIQQKLFLTERDPTEAEYEELDRKARLAIEELNLIACGLKPRERISVLEEIEKIEAQVDARQEWIEEKDAIAELEHTTSEEHFMHDIDAIILEKNDPTYNIYSILMVLPLDHWTTDQHKTKAQKRREQKEKEKGNESSSADVKPQQKQKTEGENVQETPKQTKAQNAKNARRRLNSKKSAAMLLTDIVLKAASSNSEKIQEQIAMYAEDNMRSRDYLTQFLLEDHPLQHIKETLIDFVRQEATSDLIKEWAETIASAMRMVPSCGIRKYSHMGKEPNDTRFVLERLEDVVHQLSPLTALMTDQNSLIGADDAENVVLEHMRDVFVMDGFERRDVDAILMTEEEKPLKQTSIEIKERKVSIDELLARLQKIVSKTSWKMDLTGDGCVEKNPGPTDVKMLILKLKKLKEQGAFATSSETITGLMAAMTQTSGQIVDTNTHDAQLANIKLTSVMNGTVAMNADTPMDCFTAIVSELIDTAGNLLATNAYNAGQKWNAVQGRGPNCKSTEQGDVFDSMVINSRAILSALRSNNVLMPGSDFVYLWSITQQLVNAKDSSESTHPMAGSNAWILANLMRISLQFDINVQYSSVQKHVSGMLAKPSSIGARPAVDVLMPALTVHNLAIGIGTLNDFLSYVNGYRAAGSEMSLITQIPVWVPVTEDMLAPGQQRMLNLWIASHLPGPVWSDPTYNNNVVSDAAGPVASTQTMPMAQTWDTFNVGADPAVLVVLIVVAQRAQPGALGQAPQNYNTIVATTAIASPANNPFAAAGASVDVTANFLNLATVYAANDINGYVTQALTKWNQWFGTKDEWIAASIMMSTKYCRYMNSPHMSYNTILGATTVNQVTEPNLPLVSAAEYDIPLATMRDNFGRYGDNGFVQASANIYYFSVMPIHLRLAVMTGLRAPTIDQMATNSLVTINSATIGFHLRDISRVIAAITDTMVDSFDRPHLALTGRLGTTVAGGSITSQDISYNFSRDIVEFINGICDIKDYFTALQTPWLTPAAWQTVNAASLPRMITDKSWEQSDTYNNLFTSCRKENPFSSEAIPLNALRYDNMTAGAALVIKRTDKPYAKDTLIKFLSPRIEFLPYMGQNGWDVQLTSMKSSNAVTIWYPFITAGANFWRQAYLGTLGTTTIFTTAVTSIACVEPLSVVQNFPQWNEKAHIGWTNGTDGAIMNKEAYNYVSYAPVAAATSGFNTQTIVDDSQHVADITKILQGIAPDPEKEV